MSDLVLKIDTPPFVTLKKHRELTGIEEEVAKKMIIDGRLFAMPKRRAKELILINMVASYGMALDQASKLQR